jgi:hypothetical protein
MDLSHYTMIFSPFYLEIFSFIEIIFSFILQDLNLETLDVDFAKNRTWRANTDFSAHMSPLTAMIIDTHSDSDCSSGPVSVERQTAAQWAMKSLTQMEREKVDYIAEVVVFSMK